MGTEKRQRSDESALDAIAALMDGKEWDSGTTSKIAEIVLETGRQIRDVDEVDDEDEEGGE